MGTATPYTTPRPRAFGPSAQAGDVPAAVGGGAAGDRHRPRHRVEPRRCHRRPQTLAGAPTPFAGGPDALGATSTGNDRVPAATAAGPAPGAPGPPGRPYPPGASPAPAPTSSAFPRRPRA